MRVPDVQKRLRVLAEEHNLPELNKLASHLNRRRPRNRAPAVSRRITEDLRAEIRAVALSNPTLTQVEIGRRFNVNPGRVSEAVRGLRK